MISLHGLSGHGRRSGLTSGPARRSAPWLGLALVGILAALPVHAGTEARSFCNDTGQSVNDWHVTVRSGAASLNYVKSGGLAPTFTPMPSSDAPIGGGPYSGATLAGANVGKGGCISVNYSYDPLTPGNLDWYWTQDGAQVGAAKKDAQSWFVSLTNLHGGIGTVTFTIANTANADAVYSNFQIGTTNADPTIGPFTFDPGHFLSPSDVYLPPSGFTLPAGGSRNFTFFDVFVDLQIGAYGDITLPNESYFQMTAQPSVPESAGWLLLIAGMCLLRGVVALRRP